MPSAPRAAPASKPSPASRTLKTDAGLGPSAVSGMFLAKIRIHLKSGVSDPEGNNTLKALHLLGFDSIRGVSTERIIQLRLEAPRKEDAQAEAEKACRRLLTNPVIHDYRIDVEESK